MNAQRKKMMDAVIEKNGVGAIVFWRPDELVLALGYQPLWGVSFLLYTGDDSPVLLVPELEPEDRLPEGVTVRKFPWGVMNGSDPWEELYPMMREVLTERKLVHLPVSFIRAIGGTSPCIMSGEQPPLPADLTERLATVSDGGFRDLSSDLLHLYRFKTDEDIQHLKRAHTVAAAAVDAFYKNLIPGTTEAGLAGIIEAAVQTMTGSDGIAFSKAWPMVQSGINAVDGGRFNRSTKKPLGEAELVMVEMGICVNGYWADITRTGQTGAVDDEKESIFNTVLTAQQMAIAAMKPGIRMAEVDRIAREYIGDAGYGPFFNHALGHQVGFRYHDPGAVLSPFSNSVLETGMVLTVEPGIYGEKPGCGVRIEDNVLITENGFEILSDYGRLLTMQ